MTEKETITVIKLSRNLSDGDSLCYCRSASRAAEMVEMSLLEDITNGITKRKYVIYLETMLKKDFENLRVL